MNVPTKRRKRPHCRNVTRAIPVRKRRTKEWKAGDFYESCGGHPVLCTEADEGDPHGGLLGISLVDGTYGHGCSKSACAPRRLTVAQAMKMREA